MIDGRARAIHQDPLFSFIVYRVYRLTSFQRSIVRSLEPCASSSISIIGVEHPVSYNKGSSLDAVQVNS